MIIIIMMIIIKCFNSCANQASMITGIVHNSDFMGV